MLYINSEKGLETISTTIDSEKGGLFISPYLISEFIEENRYVATLDEDGHRLLSWNPAEPRVMKRHDPVELGFPKDTTNITYGNEGMWVRKDDKEVILYGEDLTEIRRIDMDKWVATHSKAILAILEKWAAEQGREGDFNLVGGPIVDNDCFRLVCADTSRPDEKPVLFDVQSDGITYGETHFTADTGKVTERFRNKDGSYWIINKEKNSVTLYDFMSKQIVTHPIVERRKGFLNGFVLGGDLFQLSDNGLEEKAVLVQYTKEENKVVGEYLIG